MRRTHTQTHTHTLEHTHKHKQRLSTHSADVSCFFGLDFVRICAQCSCINDEYYFLILFCRWEAHESPMKTACRVQCQREDHKGWPDLNTCVFSPSPLEGLCGMATVESCRVQFGSCRRRERQRGKETRNHLMDAHSEWLRILEAYHHVMMG